MLVLKCDRGDWIRIGENCYVQIVADGLGNTRLAVTAPRDVRVMRGTVDERDGRPIPEFLLGIRERVQADQEMKLARG
jgi:hypothetical protein